MKLMNSFYSPSELKNFEFRSYGENVLISRKASIYSPDRISFGNNVRVDDFCILSPDTGSIEIGSFVHIAAYTALYGKKGIEIKDFSGLAPRATVFSASDDFAGKYLTPSPVFPKQYSYVWGGRVIINKYVIVGVGSVIMPLVVLGEGSAIGAMSLVEKDTMEWGIYKGIPARLIKKRSKDLKKIEMDLIKDIKNRENY